MTKIVKQYSNRFNGGQERVTLHEGKFYIASDWGKGFSYDVEVSREQLEACMDYTDAPVDVRNCILPE